MNHEQKVPIYIGQSFSMRRRLSSHPRRPDFLSITNVCVAWFLVPYEHLPEVEIAMIDYFKPILNTAKGGNGRPITVAAGYAQLTLRLPPALLERLKQMADDEKRPVNTQAILLLEHGLLPRKAARERIK